MNFTAARENMIESQLRTNKVTDKALLMAMHETPREFFLPKSLYGVAYIDEDLEIKSGRFLMEPMVFARLVQAANITRETQVLVVGAGSGYEAAILARLSKEVVAQEKDRELIDRAKAAWKELKLNNIRTTSKNNKYDVILINGAVAKIPTEILNQLSVGGKLITVKNKGGAMGKAVLITRTTTEELFDAATPYLPGFDPEPDFIF